LKPLDRLPADIWLAFTDLHGDTIRADDVKVLAFGIEKWLLTLVTP
jgi:hypothetical protein